MGLREHIRAGASLSRQSITLQTNITGSGSIDLGSAYALLSIDANVPCRLRLYDNSASRDDVLEKNRTFGDTNISASTALIGDFNITETGKITIDPVVYGVVQTPSNKLTYYKIDGTPSASIILTRYLLEDSSLDTNNRTTLPTITGLLEPNEFVTGTLSNPLIPTTYLLVSASLGDVSHLARIRLYNNNSVFSNITEMSRSFSTETTDTSLIVDAILSGSGTTHFSPKIIGSNLENLGTNLNLIQGSAQQLAGENELYYILQNASPTPGAVTINAFLHVFSLEN
jgi:hypothetical protein